MALSKDLVDALQRLDACKVSNALERFECRLRNEGFADAEDRVVELCRSADFSLERLRTVVRQLE